MAVCAYCARHRNCIAALLYRRQLCSNNQCLCRTAAPRDTELLAMNDVVIPIEAIRTFRNLAIRYLGLAIDETWEPLIAARIAKRLTDLRMPLHRYLFRLYQDKAGDEIVAFWDLLQPTRARFFEPWDDYLQLHSRVARQIARGQRRFRLWSAGCGSAEEGYSLALTVHHAASSNGLRMDDLDLKILVTDVSPASIERGKRGVFNHWQLQHIPANLGHYFRPRFGGIEIADSIRRYMAFRLLNFSQTPFNLAGDFDGVFCRRAVAALVPKSRAASVEEARILLTDGGLFCADADLAVAHGSSLRKSDSEALAGLHR